MKKILSIMMIATAFAGGMTSCSDFLEEDNKTGESAGLTYQTKSGIDGLVSAMYAYGRGYWGKEGAHGLTEGGTDLFYAGGDNQQRSLVTYDFGSECPGTGTAANKNSTTLDQYWEYFFAGIEVCNNVLEWVPKCVALETETEKNNYLGEAYFMKALLYSQMVAMWGPLPWHEGVTTSVSTTPTRLPEAVIYKNILGCLDQSLKLLTPGAKPTDDGHATYYSAMALKARVALYAASWLGKDAVEGYNDLYKTAQDCAQEVIDKSGASFYDNASYTWNLNNEDASVNKECLFAVHYTDNASDLANNGIPYRFADGSTYGTLLNRNGTNAQGNGMNLFYVSKWSNAGCKDFGTVKSNGNDIFARVTDAKSSVKNGVDVAKYYSPYGLGYRRYLPSLYLWKELDKVKGTDQRFNVTMLTSYNCHPELVQYAKNYPDMNKQSYKTYEEAFAEDGNYFNGGVPAIVYSALDGNSEEGKALQAEAKNKYRLTFAYGGDLSVYTSGDPATALPTTTAKAISDVYGDARYNSADVAGVSSYPGIKKFLNDEMYSVNGETYYPCSKQVSKRDCIVLRLAEMYLIKAEAQLYTDGPSAAAATIDQLRAKRAIPGKDNSLQAAYGEAPASCNIETILRERALELCGEYQRWFDLKRTHTLLKHIKAYNAQASGNISLKHYYRPIPATEFALVSNPALATATQYAEGDAKEGVLQYTTESADFWQNPGFDF